MAGGEGDVGGSGCAGWRGIKGEKWDNCNSIINKIYFLKIINLYNLLPAKMEA